MTHKEALAKIQDLQIQQGWTTQTLLNLVLDYFKNTDTTEFLAGFLAAVAKDEE